jgi:hypothetical protein
MGTSPGSGCTLGSASPAGRKPPQRTAWPEGRLTVERMATVDPLTVSTRLAGLVCFQKR